MKKLSSASNKFQQQITPNKNHIVCGDCEEWLPKIPAGSIDMCYIDPPFFSNKNYEIIWGNGYELRSFDDRWGGINIYIEWMDRRIKMIHRCLKDTGAIFLHCDYRASHHLRIMLDDIFGNDNFLNEIIWCYSGPVRCTRFFPRKHDTILYYSKSGNHCFNIDKARIPHKRQKPSTGKGMASGNRSKEEIKLMEIESLKKGKVVEDHWTDIASGSHMPKQERIGYRTQKPEKLLNRIIQCSTNEGDAVLDCFAGGGTTAAVAAKLNRKFIVGDVSPVAIRVIRDRLDNLEHPPDPEVHNIPRTEEEWLAMDGHTFAEEICRNMGWECNPKKSGDGGIDGWASNKTIPIQIKNSKNIGINPIKNFFASLGKAQEGIFVAHSFTKTAQDYRAQTKRNQGKDIAFKTVREILKGILIDNDKQNEIEGRYKKYKKVA